MCEELKVNPIFFPSLSRLQFDLLKLSASCALCWFKCLCWSVCFCLHTQTPQAWMSVRKRLSLTPTHAANMFFCMRAHTHQNLHLRLFWSGLIFPSIPLPWREEWREAGVVIRGIDHRRMSWWGLLCCWSERAGGGMDSDVLGEKKKQNLHGQYLLPWQLHGDRLITSSIPQNRLKWECTELRGGPVHLDLWVNEQLCPWILERCVLSQSMHLRAVCSSKLWMDYSAADVSVCCSELGTAWRHCWHRSSQ